MKKLTAVIITLGMFAGNVFADFDATSFRIDGINTELSRIIQDEYTDWQANPADILAISGQRFYSIASNLDGKGDTLSGGASGAFQFGYVGNPLKNMFLPSLQYGVLLHQDSAFGVSAAGTPGGFGAATSTKETNHTVTTTDVDADGTFISTGDTTATVDISGERYIEMENDDSSVTLGTVLGEGLDLAISVRSNNTTSEEPINTTYDNTTTVVGTPFPAVTEANSRNAKEELTTTDLTIAFGGRLRITDGWNVGAVFAMEPFTDTQERSSTVSINLNHTTAAAAPGTFTATGTDVTEIDGLVGGGLIAVLIAASAVWTPADGTTDLDIDGTGFGWTGGNLGGLAGVIMDPDAVGKVEDDGTARLVTIDSYFDISENATLYGNLTVNNMPFDRKLSATNNASATIVDSTLTGAADITTYTKTETYTGTSGDNERDITTFTLGVEQDLPGNVKIGYGVIYQTDDTDTNVTFSRVFSTVMTSDADGNGLNVAEADVGSDARITSTRTRTNKGQTEIEITTFQFPVGCELQPFKKLKLRLGATHRVRETVTKTRSTVLTDTGITTVAEAAGVAPATVITTASTVGDTANYTEVTTKVRTTMYYYGAGYQWSENLVFDILGFADSTTAGAGGGAGLLELSNWRIGATLLFGGSEEL